MSENPGFYMYRMDS